MDKGLLMNCREKSQFCCGKFYGRAQSNVQPKCFSYLCLNYTWSGQFFFGGGWGGEGREIHCLGLYQNDLYRNKLISQWLVSQSLSIKLSSGIVAASDVYPKKIYKKQANWLNDKTMVLNSICELSWLFSVSHHRKLVWSYRSVICLCVRHQLLVFFRWVLKTVKIKKRL